MIAAFYGAAIHRVSLFYLGLYCGCMQPSMEQPVIEFEFVLPGPVLWLQLSMKQPVIEFESGLPRPVLWLQPSMKQPVIEFEFVLPGPVLWLHAAFYGAASHRVSLSYLGLYCGCMQPSMEQSVIE